MGRTYPVIEFPGSSNPKSLFGKPAKEGYDSHFVWVRPAKNVPGEKSYVPLKNVEDECKFNDKVYSEIVIFQETQLLPRYLVYIKKKN